MQDTHPAAIAAFVAAWKDQGDEKGQAQAFWLALLRDIFDVPRPEAEIRFEARVRVDGQTKFVDAYLPRTRVLVEQKAAGRSLDAPEKQSDGTSLTPFQQARRYADALEYSRRPRWIVTSNFREIRIHDLDRPNPEADPEIILLEDLPSQWRRLTFLVDPGDALIRREQELSIRAGEIVGRLYDLLLAQCDSPDDPETLHRLNILCVRIVFCLYAEDAGILGGHKAFCRHIGGFAPDQLADALQAFFDALATPPEARRTRNPALLALPHVNGGLFILDDEFICPPLTQEIADCITEVAGAFSWSEISPTIFGALFESTLNPETRRRGGMHYTSVANIHRVIDPLFLDDLRAELDAIKRTTAKASLTKKLNAFIQKLSKLTFLDPACGSGNFLTETYISLRRLENEALEIIHRGKKQLVLPILVGIGQFRGIEINGFAVAVARTALWIAESQMHRETEDFCRPRQDYLPLSSSPDIREGNALRMDWPEADFIMGNPPFVGARMKNPAQRDDILATFGPKWPGWGDLDYVACWFRRAADVMRERPSVRAAFVATNSVCQGISVANLWKGLMDAGIRIGFAWRTFRWDSESRGMAHVHCVVVGFGAGWDGPKAIHDANGAHPASNINAYLLDAENVFVAGRSRPLCDVPEIGIGNKPIDGGHYLFMDAEKAAFLEKEPGAAPWFRPWYGAQEFLDGTPRWCLFLRDCPPEILRGLPECRKRIAAVRQFRLKSRSAGTRAMARTPLRFHVENFPEGSYVVIPEVTTERREYIPMGYLGDGVICSNKVRLLPNAAPCHFGILTSSAHNAWMRTVGGRLKSDYSYSNAIVYNTFPWPEMTEAQRTRIAALAQGVLDARAAHPGASLADLYDPDIMPDDLRRAHRALDRAVLALYGLKAGATEPEIVAELFRRYAALAAEQVGAQARGSRMAARSMPVPEGR